MFRKSRKTGNFVTKDQKAKAGIDFAIRQYGETLKDLARYDKGERFSR